jgi:hypothetical protein
MPVNKPSAAYTETIDQVTRVRDTASGNDAVKDKGTLYLPQLSKQTNKDYEAYKMRGFVMPVVKPTASALTGAIMRKKPSSELPAKLAYLEDDSDGHGRDLSMVATSACSELLLAGRYGLLGEVTETGVSICTYDRESIINWSDDYIVLKQSYSVPNEKDKFTIEVKDEYLELTFDESGLYIQNVWRKGKGKGFAIVNTLEPSVNGRRLDKLPFEFINTVDATEKLTPPALLHLADTNLDQYRLSTDLRHGLHWTALPTLFLFGELVDDKGKQVSISVGAGSSNHIQDSDARAELLEFTGAGLGAIDTAIKEDIETMASIGARMLQSKPAGVKAAETARIEQSGESATLSTIAQSVENGITNLLVTLAEWSGVNGEIKYELNKDFIDSSLTPQQVTAYLQAYQTEAISLDTFLNLLHKGELLPKGITPEDEADRIDSGRDFNDE